LRSSLTSSGDAPDPPSDEITEKSLLLAEFQMMGIKTGIEAGPFAGTFEDQGGLLARRLKERQRKSRGRRTEHDGG
jgi:hypothetical protein